MFGRLRQGSRRNSPPAEEGWHLIVGLGNPGKEYDDTRHNIGFHALEDWVSKTDEMGDWVAKKDLECQEASGRLGDTRVIAIKPQTFMNLSGQAVQPAVAFYKVPLEELLVISDDLDLPIGALRIRASGSSGGHRGLESVIGLLGSDGFARVRIGIGRAERADAVSHVLGGFSPEEEAQIDAAVQRAADAVECWIADGVTAAMNRFNRTERPNHGAGPGKSDKGVAS